MSTTQSSSSGDGKAAKKESPKSTSTTESKSDSSTASSSGGKSMRDSIGGSKEVHYGYFSSVRTPEYRAGEVDSPEICVEENRRGQILTTKIRAAQVLSCRPESPGDRIEPAEASEFISGYLAGREVRILKPYTGQPHPRHDGVPKGGINNRSF